jgi:hypothetical protein
MKDQDTMLAMSAFGWEADDVPASIAEGLHRQNRRQLQVCPPFSYSFPISPHASLQHVFSFGVSKATLQLQPFFSISMCYSETCQLQEQPLTTSEQNARTCGSSNPILALFRVRTKAKTIS